MPGNFGYLSSIGYELYGRAVLDYNGDGKDDFMTVRDASSHPGEKDCSIYTFDFGYNNGTYYTPQPFYRPSASNTMTRLATSDYPSAYHTQGTPIYTGDFNGDGKKDVFTWVPTGSLPSYGIWEIAYSLGANQLLTPNYAFHYNPTPLPAIMSGVFNGYEGNFLGDTYNIRVADFDGDGKDDILLLKQLMSTDPVTFSLFYAKGNNEWDLETGTITNGTVKDEDLGLGDFNGDGQVDLISHIPGIGGAANTVEITYFHKNEIKHAVSSIEHAGKRVEIEFMPLSQMEYGDVMQPIWEVNSGLILDPPYFYRDFPIRLVTNIRDNFTLNNEYSYRNAIVHLQGLGFQGFDRMLIKDVTADKITDNRYTVGSGNANAWLSYNKYEWTYI